MDTNINFLWIGDRLTEIGIMSLNSYHKQGYKCTLWCYEEIENVPSFVIVKNANTITELKKGTKVLFSDYFRYKLLYKKGGVYSDLDNIIIKKLPLKGKYLFSGEVSIEVNSHLIKAPKSCPMLKSIIKEIEEYKIFDYSKVFNGLYLLNKIKEYSLESYIVDSYQLNFFNSDSIRLCFEEFEWKSLKNIYCIHLFESQHRVAYKNNVKYNTNINNLKQLTI